MGGRAVAKMNRAIAIVAALVMAPAGCSLGRVVRTVLPEQSGR